MFGDVSSCNTYNYGDALYWDARYVQEAGSFDWYQRYSALRPFVRKYAPTSSRILMVGCGNAASTTYGQSRCSRVPAEPNVGNFTPAQVVPKTSTEESKKQEDKTNVC